MIYKDNADYHEIRVVGERNKKAEPVSPGSSNMVRSALSRRCHNHHHHHHHGHDRYGHVMITIMKTPSNITIAPSKASKDDPPPLSEIDIDRLQISQQDLRILEILALRF